MLQMNQTIKKEENTLLPSLLSFLSIEVDDIFFSLRKADQIIRRELNLLTQQKVCFSKKIPINYLSEEKFKNILDKFSSQKLLVDEYIIYMLRNEKNSIYNILREYNLYLDKRKEAQEDKDCIALMEVDEKLLYYIRHLGAMTYHLNIHLNLLSVLLRNTPVVPNTQPTGVTESQEIVTEYMVNEWGERQRDVRFLEITIEGAYALVTWELEDLRGDAILLQNEGYWQLISISAGVFGVEDFDNADVPLDVAQRMLKVHHQKLGY